MSLTHAKQSKKCLYNWFNVFTPEVPEILLQHRLPTQRLIFMTSSLYVTVSTR